MAENNGKKIFPFLDKLKKIKHLDIILTVLFIAVILLIYFSTIGVKKSTSDNNNNAHAIENTSSEFDDYVSNLKNQMEDVISSIDGAGQVKVLLYFKEGIKTDIAYKVDVKTLSDGSVQESKSPVLITKEGSEEPIILQKIMPNPSSIVIVASGAKSTNVKLEILRLVEATLKLDSANIEIFAGN